MAAHCLPAEQGVTNDGLWAVNSQRIDGANRSFSASVAVGVEFSSSLLAAHSEDRNRTPRPGSPAPTVRRSSPQNAGETREAYGARIHTALSDGWVGRGRGVGGAFVSEAFFFFLVSVLSLINPDNNRGRKWEEEGRRGRRSGSLWWCRCLASTLRGCRFKLAEGSRADGFPLAGEESVARSCSSPALQTPLLLLLVATISPHTQNTRFQWVCKNSAAQK